MSLPINPKFISNDMATDAELDAASTEDRKRANHTGTQTASTISDFSAAASAAAPVQSVNTKTGAVVLNKTDVGLSNVDNTSDLNKPISSATQTALNAKENTSNKNIANGYAGLNASSKIAISALPFRVIAGPGAILSFSGTLFQNSTYAPGVGVNSTPSSFGFYPVQTSSFVFNPFQMLGSNVNYRIYATKRQDSAFNDGLHCMIRQVVNGSESGIPGLLDWGSGVNSFSAATSNVLNSGTSDSFIWYRCYFAAYNGGNGATIQDLTLWIITE